MLFKLLKKVLNGTKNLVLKGYEKVKSLFTKKKRETMR